MDVREFQQLAQQVRLIKLEEIDRSQDFGKVVDFAYIKKVFSEIRSYLFQFIDSDNTPADVLPESAMSSVQSYLQRLLYIKSTVVHFDQGDVTLKGNNVISDLKYYKQEVKEALASYLPLVTNTWVRLKESFDDAAAQAKRVASYWLLAAIIATVAVMPVVLFASGLFGGNTEPVQLVLFGQDFLVPPGVVYKLVLITLLATALRFSLSNYRTQKHLSELNFFRARTFTTIERIIAWRGMSPQIKDQLLKGASKALFDFNDSGYLESKGKGGGGGGSQGLVVKMPGSGLY